MKVDAEAAGLDERRLERITEHLQRRYIDAGKIAGCQVAVARHDQPAYHRAFGSMDLEREKPVGDDTIWRLFSMTKPITGVALLTLYEQGQFQLRDRVSRFIPDWRDLKVAERQPDGSTLLVEPHREMTVKDLLMHMSGLRFVGGRDITEVINAELAGESARGGTRGSSATLETLCAQLAEQPLAFHPGTHWLYTLSTDICGRLVEIISGQRFDEYLRDAVFEPLGMVDTGFSVPDDKIDRLAALYGRTADKRLRLLDDPERSRYRKPPSFLSGGGGLLGTLGDYLRFGRMLANGGELDGVRILSRKTVELMGTNHLAGDADIARFALPGGYGEVDFEGMGFGLTVAVHLGPARSGVIGNRGEFMWGGAASTIFWVDPVEELTAVFMTQLIPSGTFDFRNQLKAIVYGAIVD